MTHSSLQVLVRLLVSLTIASAAATQYPTSKAFQPSIQTFNQPGNRVKSSNRRFCLIKPIREGPEKYPKYNSLAQGASNLFKKFCENPPGHFSIAPVKCLIRARAKSVLTIEDTPNRREQERKGLNARTAKLKIRPISKLRRN